MNRAPALLRGMTILLLAACVASAGEVRPVPATVHIDSDVSEGDFTIEKLAQLAEERGVEVLVITDRDNATVEYGVWPLRNIIKKTMRRDSIRGLGAAEYLRRIEEAQEKHPNLVIIPGAECLPYYYWDESKVKWPSPSSMKENLEIVRLYQHVLVIGMDEPADYENLPSIARGYPVKWWLAALWAAAAVVMLVIGLVLLVTGRKKGSRGQDDDDLPFGAPRRKAVRLPGQMLIGLVLAAASVAVGYNFVLHPPRMIDQYGEDRGAAPYQEFIDYVNDHGGMVVWAHPEVAHNKRINGIQSRTAPYGDMLLSTRNCTGFAIFWEGYKTIGRPGGIWDQVLKEYCQGVRSKPVWAFGESDFEGQQNPEILTETQTFLLLEKKDREHVLDAMRTGRMFATSVQAHDYFTWGEFAVKSGGKAARSGETLLSSDGEIEVEIRFSMSSAAPSKACLLVVRDGKVVYNELAGQGLTEPLRQKLPAGKTYYRFVILDPGRPAVASNPIFVEVPGKQPRE